jgi:hypothetical protein
MFVFIYGQGCNHVIPFSLSSALEVCFLNSVAHTRFMLLHDSRSEDGTKSFF